MNYINKIIIAITIIIILLGGWYIFSKKSADKKNTTASPINTMTLDMKTWTWIKTIYNNDTELVPKDAGKFTLTFKNDRTFSATTDCNTINGTYEVDNDQITFGENFISTRMFCEGSQEQEFLAMLGEVKSFLFTSQNELIFQLKLDSGSAIFR
jgi:heat shock protein HslJ